MLKIIIALLFISTQAMAMTFQRIPISTNVSMGASFFSTAVNVQAVDLASIQAVWTGGGAPAGDFIVQVSNDDVTPVDWSTYPGSLISIAGDGDLAYNIADLGYKWCRLAYTRTGGTGTINAAIVTKQEGTL